MNDAFRYQETDILCKYYLCVLMKLPQTHYSYFLLKVLIIVYSEMVNNIWRSIMRSRYWLMWNSGCFLWFRIFTSNAFSNYHSIIIATASHQFSDLGLCIWIYSWIFHMIACHKPPQRSVRKSKIANENYIYSNLLSNLYWRLSISFTFIFSITEIKVPLFYSNWNVNSKFYASRLNMAFEHIHPATTTVYTCLCMLFLGNVFETTF